MSYPITEKTLKRLKDWKEGGIAGPTNLELFFTQKCNLKCKFCKSTYNGDPDLKGEMSWETLSRIIDEAHDIGVETFFITGGEPVCRDEVLTKAIEKIKDYNMIGHLVTNGTLLSDSQIKRIVESGWDHIMISLDSPVEEIHDYLRGSEGAYQDVLETLRSFKKWKEKLDKEFPVIIITCVITSVNFETIPKFVTLAKNLEIDEIRFQPTIVYVDQIKRYKIKEEDNERLKKIARDTAKLMEDFDYSTNIGEFIDSDLVEKSSEINEVMEEESKKDGEDAVQCYQPWYGLKITPTGKVGPCESDFTWKSPINIKNKSLEEIWYGKYFESIRKKIKQGLPEECSKCCVGKVFEQREIREKLEGF